MERLRKSSREAEFSGLWRKVRLVLPRAVTNKVEFAASQCEISGSVKLTEG